MWTRRDFLRIALAMPAGAWLARFDARAAPVRGTVKITAVKALGLDFMGDGCLIRIETDAGITGYGEAGVDALTARARIPALQLVGADPLAIERHFQAMTTLSHGAWPNVALISGIDIALWDVAGKILDLPIYRLLGGPLREGVLMYTRGDYLEDMNDPAQCRAWAQAIRAQAEGFTLYKFEPMQALYPESFRNEKLINGHTIGEIGPEISNAQLRRIAKAFENVRAAVGDDIDIAIHCHNQWDTPSAIALSRAIEPIKPLYIEDPLREVEYCESWSAVKRETRTPVLTGERLQLTKQFKPFLDAQAVDIIHPDISFSGGITGCRKVADYAGMLYIPMAMHNVGTLVRTYASIQLGASVLNFFRAENPTFLPGRTAKMAARNPPVIRKSTFQLPEGPGLGLEIDPDFIRQYTPRGEGWA